MSTAAGVLGGVIIAAGVLCWLTGRWMPPHPARAEDVLERMRRTDAWGPDAGESVPYLPAEVADFDQWQAELEDQR